MQATEKWFLESILHIIILDWQSIK